MIKSARVHQHVRQYEVGQAEEGKKGRTNRQDELMMPPCGDHPQENGKQKRRDPEDEVF